MGILGESYGNEMGMGMKNPFPRQPWRRAEALGGKDHKEQQQVFVTRILANEVLPWLLFK